MSRLRTELSEEEFLHFAAYYDLKSERERQEMEKAKRSR